MTRWQVPMLLEDQVALVYGAGGPIGGAVARAFARSGAALFIAGRTLSRLEAVAEELRQHGGAVSATALDALDESAVETFVNDAVRTAGRIDISFNAISYQDVQKPLMELSPSEIIQPIQTAIRAQFLTTRAAARHMIKRGSGVILAFGGDGPQTLPGLGGFKIALDAVEGLRRQWAVELAPHGIRVVTLLTGGVPESIPADFPGRAQIEAGIVGSSPMKRAATLEDVGNVAAFVASDMARTITGAAVNISAGAILE